MKNENVLNVAIKDIGKEADKMMLISKESREVFSWVDEYWGDNVPSISEDDLLDTYGYVI